MDNKAPHVCKEIDGGKVGLEEEETFDPHSVYWIIFMAVSNALTNMFLFLIGTLS